MVFGARRIINRVSDVLNSSCTRIGLHLLPRLYRDECVYFEQIRRSRYNDYSYKMSLIRKKAHVLEKVLLRSKVAQADHKIKQIEELIAEVGVDSNDADYNIIAWAQQVVDDGPKDQGNGKAAGENEGDEYGSMGADVSKAICERRSIRSYADRKVPPEQIFAILESGLWAPSGCNKQPIEYLVIENRDDIRFCKNIAGEGNPFPLSASFAVVILVDTRNYALPVERHMVYLDAGACIQNMLLKAFSLGVGSCWLFWNDRKNSRTSFQARFSISPWFLPASMVCFGYPSQIPGAPARKGVTSALKFANDDRSDLRKFLGLSDS